MTFASRIEYWQIIKPINNTKDTIYVGGTAWLAQCGPYLHTSPFTWFIITIVYYFWDLAKRDYFSKWSFCWRQTLLKTFVLYTKDLLILADKGSSNSSKANVTSEDCSAIHLTICSCLELIFLFQSTMWRGEEASHRRD